MKPFPRHDPNLDRGQLVRRSGRALFAIGLIGIGSTHFLFGRFTTGRAPAWPEGLGGGTAWAYASGALVVLFGLSILLDRYVRAFALGVAGMIFVWALLRQLPAVAGASVFGGPWTFAGKALTLTGGALAMVAERGTRRGHILVTIARVSFGTFLLIAGVQHFQFTPFVASLFPAWFPGDPLLWSRVAGVALLAVGAGSIVPRTAPAANLMTGAMIFSWFWIIHLPRALVSQSDTIAVFEALAFAGLGFLLAVKDHPPQQEKNGRRP